MLTFSNALTFARAPLALLFLQHNPTLRLIAIFLAMVTDSIDGYFARRSQSSSRFGAILDPAMDKFFVLFALIVFYHEGQLQAWQLLAMLTRDLSLILFGLYLLTLGRHRKIHFRAIWWGKGSTALQFLILMGLTLSYTFPWYFYAAFIAMGSLAFVEMFDLIKK